MVKKSGVEVSTTLKANQVQATALTAANVNLSSSLSSIVAAGETANASLIKQNITLRDHRLKLTGVTETQRKLGLQSLVTKGLIDAQNAEYLKQSKILTVVKAKTDKQVLAEQLRTQAMLSALVARKKLTAAEAVALGSTNAMLKKQVELDAWVTQGRLKLREGFTVRAIAEEARLQQSNLAIQKWAQDKALAQEAANLKGREALAAGFAARRIALEGMALDAGMSPGLVAGMSTAQLAAHAKAQESAAAAGLANSSANARVASSHAGAATATAAHTKATRGLTTAQANLHGVLRGTAGAAGMLWLTYGQILPLLAAAGATAVTLSAFKMGAAFQTEMRYIQGLTQQTTVAMNDLNESILDLAANTIFTPTQLVQGLRVLSQAGLNLNQSMEALIPVMTLARIGEMDVAEAADIAQTAMHAFGMTANEVGNIVNILAQAASMSATTVKQIAAAMTTGSEVGVLYGTTLEEMNAALAVLAQRHVVGQSAGTAFKNMMRDIDGATDKASHVIKGLGINTHDAYGEMKPLVPLLGEIKRTLDEFDPEAKQKLMRMWMTMRGVRAFVPLLDQADGFLIQSYAAMLTASEGLPVAQTIIKQLTTALSGEALIAVSRYERTLIQAFQNVEEEATKIIRTMGEIAQGETFKTLVNTVVSGTVHLTNFILEHREAILTLAKAFTVLIAIKAGAAVMGAGIFLAKGLKYAAVKAVQFTKAITAANTGSLTLVGLASKIAPNLRVVGGGLAGIAAGLLLFTNRSKELSVELTLFKSHVFSWGEAIKRSTLGAIKYIRALARERLIIDLPLITIPTDVPSALKIVNNLLAKDKAATAFTATLARELSLTKAVAAYQAVMLAHDEKRVELLNEQAVSKSKLFALDTKVALQNITQLKERLALEAKLEGMTGTERIALIDQLSAQRELNREREKSASRIADLRSEMERQITSMNEWVDVLKQQDEGLLLKALGVKTPAEVDEAVKAMTSQIVESFMKQKQAEKEMAERLGQAQKDGIGKKSLSLMTEFFGKPKDIANITNLEDISKVWTEVRRRYNELRKSIISDKGFHNNAELQAQSIQLNNLIERYKEYEKELQRHLKVIAPDIHQEYLAIVTFGDPAYYQSQIDAIEEKMNSLAMVARASGMEFNIEFARQVLDEKLSDKIVAHYTDLAEKMIEPFRKELEKQEFLAGEQARLAEATIQNNQILLAAKDLGPDAARRARETSALTAVEKERAVAIRDLQSAVDAQALAQRALTKAESAARKGGIDISKDEFGDLVENAEAAGREVIKLSNNVIILDGRLVALGKSFDMTSARSVEKFTQYMNDLNQALTRRIEDQDLSLGDHLRTDEEKTLIQARLQAQREFADKVRELEKQGPDFDVFAQRKQMYRDYYERVEEQAKQHYKRIKEVQGSWMEGTKSGLQKIIEGAGTNFSRAEGLVTTMFDGMTDALTRFVETGKLSFTDLANSILKEFLRIQMASMVAGLTGWLFPGAAALAAAPAAAPAPFSFDPWSAINLHSGGVVGRTNKPHGPVPALTFANAPRLHNGLNSDEFPAILQRGERVLSRREVANGGVVLNVSQSVVNNTNAAVKTNATSDGNGGVNLEVIIDQVVGKKIGEFGSSSNKTLRQAFGAQPQLTVRS